MESVRKVMRTPPSQQRPKALPFWQHLPSIFSYPLRAGAFSTILLLAILRLLDPLLGLMALNFIFNTLFSAVVHFLIALSLYRYAVQVLLDTSEGKLDPPEYSFGVEKNQATDQIKLQILLLGASVLVFLFVGLKAGLITAAVLSLITPAATMSLALQRSLWIALNPVMWVRVIIGFGPPYLAVAALSLAYGLLQLLALAFMPDSLPRIIAIPLFWWLSHYAVVSSFHAMGYLILLHHEEIGHYAPADIVLPKQRHQRDPDQLLLDEVNCDAEQGKSARAIQTLRQHLDARGGTQMAHDLYRQLLTSSDDQVELARHARQYVGVLMAQGAGVKAMQMLQVCIDADAGYCPNEANELYPLAVAASKYGKHELAVRVVLNGMKCFVKSREIPDCALLAARLLSEKLSDDAQARQLLTEVKARFPQCAQITEIDRYITRLDAFKKPV